MINILCFGDSNTYGMNPAWVQTGKFSRHEPDVRWTGRLQKALGANFNIIEEGLNGRTAVFEDPTSPARKGIDMIQACLETHSPLDAVIIMLGTNDTKAIFGANVMEITSGITLLLQTVLNPFVYSIGSVPKVILACPVPVQPTPIVEGGGFHAMVEKSALLAPAYEQLAKQLNIEFIDMGKVTTTDPMEGIHLNADGHAAVAKAFEAKIREMFPEA